MENISPCHGCGKSLSDFLPQCPSCGYAKPVPIVASRVREPSATLASPARPTPTKAPVVARQPDPESSKQRVVVTDIQIPFWSMVTLLVKLVVAAVPALVIVAMFGLSFALLVGSLHLR